MENQHNYDFSIFRCDKATEDSFETGSFIINNISSNKFIYTKTNYIYFFLKNCPNLSINILYINKRIKSN